MGDETIRVLLANEVATKGVAPTARALGVNRESLCSYLAGSARRGTIVLIEASASIVYVQP